MSDWMIPIIVGVPLLLGIVVWASARSFDDGYELGIKHGKEIKIDDAVLGFAEYLATTTSPKGTVQREKLQSFATEFLNQRPAL